MTVVVVGYGEQVYDLLRHNAEVLDSTSVVGRNGEALNKSEKLHSQDIVLNFTSRNAHTSPDARVVGVIWKVPKRAASAHDS